MAPRKFFTLLRERTLTAVIILALLAVAAFSLPGLRSELLSALSPQATVAMMDGSFEPVTEEPDAAPPDSGDKPGLFKRIVTSPVRLMSRLFRSRDRKDQNVAASTPAKEKRQSKSAPGIRPGDGMGSEVAREDLSAPDAAAAKAVPVTPTEAVLAAAERTAAAMFDQAVEFHQKGMLDQAIDKLGSVLLTRPDFAEAHNLMGVCLDQKGQFGLAQAEYQKAIKIESANPRFLNNLGYSYYLAGDNNNAIRWFKKALKVTPDDRRLHNNLGLAYGHKGDYQKSLEHFTASVGPVGAHLNLGYVFNQQGRYEDAIREYETALRLQPQSLAALSGLIPLYERTGRLREAAYASEMHRKLSAAAQQKE
ncbi:MAG TPA: tetratricopeptide repeat protein [Blastocatellia bacterium]|nr:tetratricopeptide repeat protein [Blastocatellia bacterium]